MKTRIETFPYTFLGKNQYENRYKKEKGGDPPWHVSPLPIRIPEGYKLEICMLLYKGTLFKYMNCPVAFQFRDHGDSPQKCPVTQV